MQGTFNVEESKLRELGLIESKEVVESIHEGPWTRAGMYYISIVTVSLLSERNIEFILKCPWDFTVEFMQDRTNIGGGRELITQHVENQVKWSKMIREVGPFCARMEKYDEGTIIQENIEGTNLDEALLHMTGEEANRLRSESVRVLQRIQAKTGLQRMGRYYAGTDNLEASSDFVLTPSGKIILVNLNFVQQEKPNGARTV